MKDLRPKTNPMGPEAIAIADRRDYVISCIANPIPAATSEARFSVSLDTDYPWMWTGFYVGSLYSSTASGGGFQQVKSHNLTLQIMDSNRDFLFSDYCPADAFAYAVTSSNVTSGENRNEISPINPERPQPAGGSFLIIANNTFATGNLYFELVLTGYKVKDECLRATPPSKWSVMRNSTAMTNGELAQVTRGGR
jgi:hypothetical protein